MPPPSPLEVSRDEARRFVRRALLLDAPASSVAAAMDHLGYVQIDPLNVCGRMHDHILRNRVTGYSAGGLHRHLHSTSRPGFEHYLPDAGVLVAFPMAVWPHLIERTRHRGRVPGGYAGKLSKAEETLARRILAEIAERGPLTSDDIEHKARASTAWGSGGRMVKTVLEKLMVHGRVFISERRNFRRVYDLPERVLPAALLSAASPSPEATRRWLAETRLRQRRLVILKRAELPFVEDLVQPIKVPGLPLLHCLRTDISLFGGPPPDPSPRLLGPLDPLVYDRKLTRLLWDFDYTWEAYTPAHRRKRGYYALPVLAGAEIAGHVDPKADREAGRLVIASRRLRRGTPIAPALRSLADFLGLSDKRRPPPAGKKSRKPSA